MKVAVLRPLLKKLSLDANFRPVSNLMFVSKAIEKVVATQALHYLVNNNLHEEFQSAYKQFHSTETALVRAINNQRTVLLLLLALSAVFDTAEDRLLLSRLSCRCGIKGSALAWFTSYPSG